MKLLIITQKIDQNDPILGFMIAWIKELAKHFDSVKVICLYEGDYDLPGIGVLSLGKEDGISRTKYLKNLYKYVWRERKNYDAVFVHMNPEYIVLAGWLWRILGKKITLWYAHGKVTKSLRIASIFAHKIFTSTKSGCRIKSKKVNVIGQAIDTDFFKRNSYRNNQHSIKVVTVGRVTESKDLETGIIAVLSQDVSVLDIVGDSVIERDVDYKSSLMKKYAGEKRITWLGARGQDEVKSILGDSDIFINMGLTGSLDKAIVEAMSVGLPILTCNEALKGILGEYEEKLMYPKYDAAELARKIQYLIDIGPEERQNIGSNLREIVVKNHSLQSWAHKIKSGIESI